MAIYCSADGTQHPDDANYCMKCGKPLRPDVAPAAAQVPMRWEYRELVVPLGDGPDFVIMPIDWRRHFENIILVLRVGRLMNSLTTHRGWYPHRRGCGWTGVDPRVTSLSGVAFLTGAIAWG
jgi:hypothetical protein